VNSPRFGIELNSIEKHRFAHAAQSDQDQALVMPACADPIKRYGRTFDQRIATRELRRRSASPWCVGISSRIHV